MTTHSHKQSVHTFINHGDTTLFESVDFSNPGRERDTPPYYDFGNGALTSQCVYVNPTNRTITAGPSAATDEQCIAIAHVFPATKPLMCLSGLGRLLRGSERSCNRGAPNSAAGSPLLTHGALSQLLI